MQMLTQHQSAGPITTPRQGLRLARLSPTQQPVRTQLVCFPPNGEGPISFLPWLKTPSVSQPIIPADMGLWGIQLDWTMGWTFDNLVSALTDALEEQRTPAPLVLVGVSLGALLAWGVARELRRRQAKAYLGLAVIAMSAPHRYKPSPIGENWTLDEWRAVLRRVGGTPEAVLADSSRLQNVVLQVQGGLSIAHSFAYCNEPPLAAPIAAFGGDADWEFVPDTLKGWRRQTTKSFSTHIYPGAGHLDLLRAEAIRCQFLAELVATIQTWREGLA